jgi:uncharacterized protein with HEPN domain
LTDPARLLRYLGRLSDAAERAVQFTRSVSYSEFQLDVEKQMAVTMALVLMGDAVNKIARKFPHFMNEHPDVAWDQMRGLRNAIVHQYYDLALDVLWDTVHTDLPLLICQIDQLRHPHIQGE